MFDYEWDVEKARANRRKHGVSFADAAAALEDEQALTVEDDYPDERRFITLGRDPFDRILVVVYTYRSRTIRIISARKATPVERRQYEEG
jgi:uncharacterized DUF497 family protein